MAVAVGGFFGNYFNEYMDFADSRNWNTKNYDYAKAVNKGETSESLFNEINSSNYKTAVLIKQNKSGYLNAYQGFIPAEGTVYIPTNRDGTVNNDYYVDQETGDIYLRPLAKTAAGTTSSGFLGGGNPKIYNPTTPTILNLDLSGASTATVNSQTYNWGTVGNGHSVDMHTEYTIDGSTWIPITSTYVNITGTPAGASGSGTIPAYSIPTSATQLRVVGSTTIGPPTTTNSFYSDTYDFPDSQGASGTQVADNSVSNSTAAFDMSVPVGSTGTAFATMKWDWVIGSGASAQPKIQYRIGAGAWTDLPGGQLTPALTGDSVNQMVTASFDPAALGMTNNTTFRIFADTVQSTASGPPAPYVDSFLFNAIVAGAQTSSNTFSHDLSDAVSATVQMDYNWTIPAGTSVTSWLETSTNGGTNWSTIAGTTTPGSASGTMGPVAVPGLVAGQMFRVAATTTQGPGTPQPDVLLFSQTDPVANSGVYPNPGRMDFSDGATSVTVENTIGLEQNHPSIFSRVEYLSDSYGFLAAQVNPGQDKFTITSHGLANNQAITFSGGSLPSGITAGTTYYVKYIDADNFNLSATSGPGATLDITSAGSGLLIGSTWQPLGSNPITAANLPAYNSNTSYAADFTGGPFYGTFQFGVDVPATNNTNVYGRYEYYDGSSWQAVPSSNFTITAGSGPATLNTTVGMNFPTTVTDVRLGMYSDAGHSFTLNSGPLTYYTTSALIQKKIEGGTENCSPADTIMPDHTETASQTFNLGSAFMTAPATNLRVGVYTDGSFTTPVSPPSDARPYVLKATKHYSGSLPGPLPAFNSTNVTIQKTLSSAGEDPTFTDSPNNIMINKSVTTPAGSVPAWVTGNINLTKDVSAVNGITFPATMSVSNTDTQYFGTSFYLDEVPTPESFGELQNNNLKFTVVDPAVYGLAGAVKLDYADLEVNGVKIASNSFDTSLYPAFGAADDAHYTFSNNFSAGINDFNIVSGGWNYDGNLPIAITGANGSNTINMASHGFLNGEEVVFSGGALPGGLSEGTIYYIVGAAANSFQVSATSGGAPITFSAAGSGDIQKVNGSLKTGSTGYYFATNPAGVQQTYFNGRTTDNFVVSTDIKITKTNAAINPNPITGLDDFVGIWLRGNDPTTQTFKDSGYLVAYETDTGLIKVYNAGEINSPVVASFPAPSLLPAGTSRNLEVHANGNVIDIFVDGSQVGTYTDKNYKFSNGYTSLVSLGDEASFDNFTLQSYASPIQLLSSALKKGQNSIVVKGFGTGPGLIDVAGTINGVNVSTSNIPPDLNALNGGAQTDPMHRFYRDSQLAGMQNGELDTMKGYWSVSTRSALGIAGQIQFQNREGGSLHRLRDQFSSINNIMQNLTSILGMTDDLFKSHLNVIK